MDLRSDSMIILNGDWGRVQHNWSNAGHLVWPSKGRRLTRKKAWLSPTARIIRYLMTDWSLMTLCNVLPRHMLCNRCQGFCLPSASDCSGLRYTFHLFACLEEFFVVFLLEVTRAFFKPLVLKYFCSIFIVIHQYYFCWLSHVWPWLTYDMPTTYPFGPFETRSSNLTQQNLIFPPMPLLTFVGNKHSLFTSL